MYIYTLLRSRSSSSRTRTRTGVFFFRILYEIETRIVLLLLAFSSLHPVDLLLLCVVVVSFFTFTKKLLLDHPRFDFIQAASVLARSSGGTNRIIWRRSYIGSMLLLLLLVLMQLASSKPNLVTGGQFRH